MSYKKARVLELKNLFMQLQQVEIEFLIIFQLKNLKKIKPEYPYAN